MGRPARGVPHQQEQRHGHSPKGDELGVAAGHAVTLARAVDARRAFPLDDALQGKVDGLAAELACEHEDDFGFAGGPDQGRVDDAEGLGHEGEPGAEVGYWVGGVLVEMFFY